MVKIKLNVYGDDKKTIVKTLDGSDVELMFDTIQKLMALLKIDSVKTNLDLLATINGAWEELTTVLAEAFPNATQEDFKHVKIKELIPVLVNIVKYSLAEAMSIPTEKN